MEKYSDQCQLDDQTNIKTKPKDLKMNILDKLKNSIYCTVVNKLHKINDSSLCTLFTNISKNSQTVEKNINEVLNNETTLSEQECDTIVNIIKNTFDKEIKEISEKFVDHINEDNKDFEQFYKTYCKPNINLSENKLSAENIEKIKNETDFFCEVMINEYVQYVQKIGKYIEDKWQSMKDEAIKILSDNIMDLSEEDKEYAKHKSESLLKKKKNIILCKQFDRIAGEFNYTFVKTHDKFIEKYEENKEKYQSYDYDVICEDPSPQKIHVQLKDVQLDLLEEEFREKLEKLFSDIKSKYFQPIEDNINKLLIESTYLFNSEYLKVCKHITEFCNTITKEINKQFMANINQASHYIHNFYQKFYYNKTIIEHRKDFINTKLPIEMLDIELILQTANKIDRFLSSVKAEHEYFIIAMNETIEKDVDSVINKTIGEQPHLTNNLSLKAQEDLKNQIKQKHKALYKKLLENQFHKISNNCSYKFKKISNQQYKEMYKKSLQQKLNPESDKRYLQFEKPLDYILDNCDICYQLDLKKKNHKLGEFKDGLHKWFSNIQRRFKELKKEINKILNSVKLSYDNYSEIYKLIEEFCRERLQKINKYFSEKIYPTPQFIEDNYPELKIDNKIDYVLINQYKLSNLTTKKIKETINNFSLKMIEEHQKLITDKNQEIEDILQTKINEIIDEKKDVIDNFPEELKKNLQVILGECYRKQNKAFFKKFFNEISANCKYEFPALKHKK